MTDPDSYDEMHDDQVADSLLAGRLDPLDAPAQLRGPAALFAAATSGPAPEELVHRDRIVAAGMVEVLSSDWLMEPTSGRKRSMLSKILTAKVAAAATVAAFGLGTAAAAATGSLPGQGSSHANVHTSTALDTTATPNTPSSSLPKTGPANVHAQYGLCTAFLAAGKSTSTSSVSSPTSQPPQYSATPFKALIAQNGSVAATTTYCQKVVSTRHSSSSTDSTDTNDTTSDTGHGKPANPGKSSSAGTSTGTNKGQSQGQGKPDDTGTPPSSVPAGNPPTSVPASHTPASVPPSSVPPVTTGA